MPDDKKATDAPKEPTAAERRAAEEREEARAAKAVADEAALRERVQRKAEASRFVSVKHDDP